MISIIYWDKDYCNTNTKLKIQFAAQTFFIHDRDVKDWSLIAAKTLTDYLFLDWLGWTCCINIRRKRRREARKKYRVKQNVCRCLGHVRTMILCNCSTLVQVIFWNTHEKLILTEIICSIVCNSKSTFDVGVFYFACNVLLTRAVPVEIAFKSWFYLWRSWTVRRALHGAARSVAGGYTGLICGESIMTDGNREKSEQTSSFFNNYGI